MIELSDPPVAIQAAEEQPIDCAQLARATFGDARLAREVLELFDRQAHLLMARMRGAQRAEILTFAHTLKGSARGVGAARVARMAERVEIAAAGGEAELAPALADLYAATEEARATIAELLAAR